MWFGLRVGDLNSCVHAQTPPAEPGAGGGHVRRLRPGVTLIELLITIMIISILAAAVLGVAAVAGETAREAKTKTIISRIHTLLMQHYDTYTTRRVKVRQPVLDAINSPTLNASTAQRGRLKAEARLYALREMMLMEIPDRWSDVLLNLVPSTPASGVAADPLYLDAPPVPDVPGDRANRTELAGLYLRTYRRIAGATNKITNNTNTDRDVLANQGAECLYMVVMNACGDGEARTLFPASSIADTDGDGAPEFIDGWGHPIEFLRWAPGFESDVQRNANEFGNDTTNPNWVAAAGVDHDPFDLYRVDQPAFRLVPLVCSAGRDEEFGVHRELEIYPAWRSASFNIIDSPLNMTPKFTYFLGAADYLGTDDGSKTATDNVTNHLISTR
jgi:prepilin-type N-terminal cleavage/methylation domain-containing protein